MSLDAMPTVDPAARPLLIEQPSRFFELPIELRYYIYEYTFHYDEFPNSVPQALEPLLCCRQFYMEARGIAFSETDFRFDWYDITCKYFDGVWYTDDASRKLAVHRHLPGRRRGFRDNGPPATRSPPQLSIELLAKRSSLTIHQIGALRRLTVTDLWTSYRQKISPFPIEWLVYHFLRDLRHILMKDYQLDAITIELPIGCFICSDIFLERPRRINPQELWTRWGPILARLRDMQVTKRVIFRVSQGVQRCPTPYVPKGALLSRMRATCEYYESTYARKSDGERAVVDKSYAKQPEDAPRWSWILHKCGPKNRDFYDGIEVYKEGCTPLGTSGQATADGLSKRSETL